MPNVNGKEYPYTPKGMAMAKAAKMKPKRKKITGSYLPAKPGMEGSVGKGTKGLGARKPVSPEERVPNKGMNRMQQAMDKGIQRGLKNFRGM
jgi:hypothetical protein